MSFERVHQSKSQSPQSSSNTSQFAPRPFPVQEPKRPPNQEDIENEAFHQNKFETFGLQLKEKHGTITPVEQERLGVLQAKMDSFWAQRMERAKAQPNLLEILIRNSQATQTTESQAPVQANTIQAKSDITGDRPGSSLEQRPNKTGMPDALKAGVEHLSGCSLGAVRVHYNSPKPAQLQALAYAQGTEIHVAPGQEKHLPHEAWHIVQQAQGRVNPTMQMQNGVQVNDDKGLENEADVMGEEVVGLGQFVTQEDNSGMSPSEAQRMILLQPRQAPVQRVKFKEAAEMSAEELMKNQQFRDTKGVKLYVSKLGEEALSNLLISWKDETFHNIQALTARINGEALKLKKEAQEKRAEEEAPELNRKFEEYRKNSDPKLWEGGWEEFTGSWITLAPALKDIISDKLANLICCKLALVAMFDKDVTVLFARRIKQLAQAKLQLAPLDWVGIGKTLDMVTAPLPGKPSDYSPFGGKYFDNFYGVSKQGGMPLSFKGITSELDAILSINPKELAKDEVVFSGSTYTDPEKRDQTKNVDVSYIDRDGVLHLIENGKDMNTLKNKTSGKQDQKLIYEHLMKKANSLEHSPVGSLTSEQAKRTQIEDVQWWYSIPPEALDLNESLDETAKQTLRQVAKAGAGLRCGRVRLSPQDLFDLTKK